MLHKGIGALLILLAGLLLYKGLQNREVYRHTLGKLSGNWTLMKDGETRLADTAYTSFSGDRLFRWDAAHYYRISKTGYETRWKEDEFIFAFFPLFPLLWRWLELPPAGIPFLNYAFFVA